MTAMEIRRNGVSNQRLFVPCPFHALRIYADFGASTPSMPPINNQAFKHQYRLALPVFANVLDKGGELRRRHRREHRGEGVEGRFVHPAILR
jgi:hypothetical protein